MVEAQTAILVMGGMLSGFFAGYIVKWGDDVREYYRNKLKMPNSVLPLEILTMFAVLLLFWILILFLID